MLLFGPLVAMSTRWRRISLVMRLTQRLGLEINGGGAFRGAEDFEDDALVA